MLLSEEIGMKLKTLETSAFTTGGELSEEQETTFVTTVRGSSDIMALADVNVVKNHRGEINSIWIPGRVTKKAVEATDAGEIATTVIGKDMYETVKTVSSINIANDFLLKNIEQEGFEDTIVNMMLEAVGNDLGVLAVQGDTTGGDALLETYDGLWKQSDSGHLLDNAGGTVSLSSFAAAYAQFPDHLRSKLRKELRWIGHSRLWNSWDVAQAARVVSPNDTILGTQGRTPMGIPVEICDEIQTTLDATTASATAAVVTSTNAGAYLITSTTNLFKVDIDNGGPAVHTITADTYRAVELAHLLNVSFVAAGDAPIASVDPTGHIVFTSSTTGGASEIDIQASATNMYATLGVTIAVVTGAAAGANTVPQGTYMFLTAPRNFWIGMLNQLRIYWEFQPRSDEWELTIYSETIAHLRDPDACIRVDDITLPSYL